MNRRRSDRKKQRLRVRIEPGPIHSMTGDLSAEGAFVHSQRVYEPGTEIRFQVELPSGTAEAEGVVRWAKRVPSHLMGHVRGGMGIQFTRVSDELREYLVDSFPVLLKAV